MKRNGRVGLGRGDCIVVEFKVWLSPPHRQLWVPKAPQSCSLLGQYGWVPILFSWLVIRFTSCTKQMCSWGRWDNPVGTGCWGCWNPFPRRDWNVCIPCPHKYYTETGFFFPKLFDVRKWNGFFFLLYPYRGFQILAVFSSVLYKHDHFLGVPAIYT